MAPVNPSKQKQNIADQVTSPCAHKPTVMHGTVFSGKRRKAAIEAAQQGHRNYAKRQLTWFRREPEVHWLEGFGDDAEIQRASAELVQRGL